MSILDSLYIFLMYLGMFSLLNFAYTFVNKNKYIADVVRIIGHKADPGTDILTIAYKHGIYEDFGDEVEAELGDIPNEVDPKELVNRRDLTSEIIFTIDGDDTKDIDDAIGIKKLDNGNYELGVHIADVSHYVKENTALGDVAYERGTSSYLADTVIPMIPHKLSNGICSLNEGVDRLVMACEAEINEDGNVVNYSIFEGIIKTNNFPINTVYITPNNKFGLGKIDTNGFFYIEEVEDVEKIRVFNEERDWDQFHSPENLAKSISIEAGELLECLRKSKNR